jgi:hypothetical protein
MSYPWRIEELKGGRPSVRRDAGARRIVPERESSFGRTMGVVQGFATMPQRGPSTASHSTGTSPETGEPNREKLRGSDLFPAQRG